MKTRFLNESSGGTAWKNNIPVLSPHSQQQVRQEGKVLKFRRCHEEV